MSYKKCPHGIRSALTCLQCKEAYRFNSDAFRGPEAATVRTSRRKRHCSSCVCSGRPALRLDENAVRVAAIGTCLTYSEIARQMGWDGSSLSQAMSGRRTIAPHRVEALAKVLSVDANQLVSRPQAAEFHR